MQWAIDSALDSDDDVKMAGLLALERLLDDHERRRAGFHLSNFDEQLIDDVSSAALP
jgi:hypothetical protein